MMLLIKECEVYAPIRCGVNDMLVAGGKIIRIAPNIDISGLPDAKVIDGRKQLVLPGFIDAHVHIAGAGGEGGPASRTPEVSAGSLLKNGITSVVGCLGTDGITRNVESVLMKAKALREQGISAWIYTGAYQVPVPTITGSLSRDIVLIDEIIGVGEIALSDHRSSCPTTDELTRIASQARVAGMLSGKAGILNIHMGDAPDPFAPIHKAVKNSEIRYSQFLPTHCNRNKHIFSDTFQYAMKGPVDITSGAYQYFPDDEIKPSLAIRQLIEAGVPVANITMSSDANGSLPLFDAEGRLLRLEIGGTESLFGEIAEAVREGLNPETAVSIITSNVADILKLNNKGRIVEGADADLVMISPEWKIQHVMSGGRFLFSNGVLNIQDFNNIN
jgi:beta-aspartyl-dipeptidase (metallo-type)